MADARNNLTQILQRVEKGEKITIRRHGKPVVDLVPASPTQREPRKFGTLKGKIKILDPDWAKPQDDLEAWLKGDTSCGFCSTPISFLS